MYLPLIEDEETLHQRDFDPCQTIRKRSGTLGRVRHAMIRRVHACLDSGGGHFENLLRILAWQTIRTQQLSNWERVL